MIYVIFFVSSLFQSYTLYLFIYFFSFYYFHLFLRLSLYKSDYSVNQWLMQLASEICVSEFKYQHISSDKWAPHFLLQ